MSILDVNGLSVEFKTQSGGVCAVNNISFSVKKGEVLGIVGESGSGKSQSVLSIMGLLPNNATTSGSVKFLGQEILNLPPHRLNKFRGQKISMIFQDPMTALNPYLSIQSQMVEVLVTHLGLSKRDSLNKALEMLDLVKIPDAKNRIKAYPHEFSGGMRQRVLIATALLCKPELLIADEPTTALDVTVQAQILELLKDLKQEFNMSIIMITHDMGVVANICDRVNVMYAGTLMESGAIDDIFYDAKHPYTKALLDAIPDLKNNYERLKTISGEPPNLMNLPDGCAFQKRCPQAHLGCKSGDIVVQKLSDLRMAKCNLSMTK